MSVDPNRLLLVISALRQMKWAEYSAAVDLLSQSIQRQPGQLRGSANRSYLLQSLEALGHCDVDFTEAGSVIYAAAPAVCRLPKAGLPQAVLVGARSLDTIEQIHEAASRLSPDIVIKVLQHPGSLGLLPDTILVEAASERSMGSYCEALGIRYAACPPSWTLVNWCGSLSELAATLDYRVPDDFNWPRYDFSTEDFAFVRRETDTFPRLSRYTNPVTSLPIHVFFRNGRGAEIDPRWGRYLLFYTININVIAYDERRFTVCVPLYAPLPSLIARALCLCSGDPPDHIRCDGLISGVACSDWILYSEVPPQIAMAALPKVGQPPLIRDIVV